MKKNMVYAIGFILMFSSTGAYLSAQGMGGGGYGMERGLSDDESGMATRQRGGMRQKDGHGDKKGFRKNIKTKKGHGNPEIEKEVLIAIKKHDSEFAMKLQKLKETDARKYKLVLRNSLKPLMARKRHGGGVSMEKDMVEAIKLEYETRELGFKYKKASSREKTIIEKDLKVKVSRLFDLRVKGREARLKNMEKNIENLRNRLKDRKAGKSQIVKNRVDRLTGKSYSW